MNKPQNSTPVWDTSLQNTPAKPFGGGGLQKTPVKPFGGGGLQKTPVKPFEDGIISYAKKPRRRNTRVDLVMAFRKKHEVGIPELIW